MWAILELVFFAIDMAITALLLKSRRSSVRKLLIWIIAFIAAPIVGFGAYIMVGPPLFRRRPTTHRGEDTERLRSLAKTDTERSDMYSIAGCLDSAGALRYSDDSSVRYIGSGYDYYKSMFTDILEAKRSVDIECYIIRRDRSSEEFVKLLCKRADAGISVRIMFDDYGYDGKDLKPIRELEKHGCKCILFHNMNRLIFSPLKNYRNHRKTFVIDGRIGYMGGYNIGDEYLGFGEFGRWRDAAVRIEGPQAVQLQRMFADDWAYASKEDISGDEELFPHVEKVGDMPMQVIPGDPVVPEMNAVLAQFVSLSRASRKTLYIETPYLVPPKIALYSLSMCAASGTDVRIIIPDKPDHPCVYWANRHYANILMCNGARIYEYHGGFMHAKIMVGDTKYCSVGSANYDQRSTRLNFECNIMMYSKEMGKVLEDEFMKDLEASTEYTREMYEGRTRNERIKTAMSLLNYDQL